MDIVGRLNPRVEEELRIYVGRFPHKIQALLQQTQSLYRDAFCKEKEGGEASSTTSAAPDGGDRPHKATRKPPKGEQSPTSSTEDGTRAKARGMRPPDVA